MESILDHEAISGCYFFPQARCVPAPLQVSVRDAQLNCYHRNISPEALTIIHFHGNGETVADYVPFWADLFADMGLNSLFVEYRGYGGSSGRPQLVAQLSDGQEVLRAANIPPEKSIVFGRSIGSLYAIELAFRQPRIAGLILESGIADPAERFLSYADLTGLEVTPKGVRDEVNVHFNHRRKLSGYQNPLLILHTQQDGLIDVSHAERIHDWAASATKRLVRFLHGNHNSIFPVNSAEYLDEIRRFHSNLVAPTDIQPT